MTLWKLMLREMARRPGRATLTLLSIAIGMAAIVSVSLGTATARDAYRKMYEEISGKSALQITAAAHTVFAEKEVPPAKLEEIPGVKAAVPSVQRPVVLFFGSEDEPNRLDVMLMGIDPLRDREVRIYEARKGKFLETPRQLGVLLEVGFAEGAGIHVGDEVRLLPTRGRGRGVPLPVPVVGLLAPRGAAGFNKGGVAVVSLGLAQRYFSGPGNITDIDIVLDEKADERAVEAAIRRILPPGLEVHPPASRTQTARGTYASIEQGLNVATAFALVLALLIIINTFLMNVSERRGQLAVLRAIGATRGQVVRLLLTEGLVIGVAGAGLGCLLGGLGGYGLMRVVTGLYVSTPPPVIFSPAPFIVAAILGPAVAVLAAAVPAWLTTRISPLEAMRPSVAQEGQRTPAWVSWTGALLVLGCGGLLMLSVRGALPMEMSIWLGVAFMASFVLLIPISLRPLAHAVAVLLRPILHLEARLGDRQVRRRPVRTALTIGVVYLAVGMGVGLGTTIVNNIDEVRHWYNQTVMGDFFLRAAFPNTATGDTAEVPASLRDDIAQVPGVTNVDSISFFAAQAAGQRIFIVAREYTEKKDRGAGESAEPLPLDLYQADPEKVRRQLLEGEVVVGTVLAHRAGVEPGDEITVDTRQGPKRLRIAALAIDYMVGGDIIYMHRSLAEKLFHVKGVNAFMVQAEDDKLAEVQAALATIAKEQHLMLHSFADLSRMLDTILGGVEGALWGVMVLGFVVAAFGIANTLTMNVLEQTRELALLRVVAMTRTQVRRLVLAQAIIIGLIGLALGMIAGLNTAKAISMSMMPLLGYPVPFVVHPALLIGSFAAGLVLVFLAVLLPAERAARLDLLIALQYE